MTRPRLSAIAFGGYILLAVCVSWPLPARLTTALPGPPSGDTGVYVWNLWVFRHEVVQHHRFPTATTEVFSLTPPVSLSLHNYTPLANVLAFPLLPHLGTIATYNVLMLLFLALDGWCTFLLARHVTGRTAESWLAGALFEASPVMMARFGAHFSLIAAFPLPLIVLSALRGLDTGRRRYALATGACVAMAGFCDPYYAVYGTVLVGILIAVRLFNWHWHRQPLSTPWLRCLDAALAILAGLILVILLREGRTLEFFGMKVAMRTLYTPMLLLTVATVLRVIASWRPSISVAAAGSRTAAIRFAGVAALVCVGLLSPTLFAMGEGLSEGRFDRVPIYWRSSPPGVDLLAFVMPNPNHPIYGEPYRAWLTKDHPDGFPEFTAAVPLAAVILIGLAWIRWRACLPGLWLGLATLAAALALGPFVHVAGVNTQVPGPWAFLRYVPVLEWARSPSRFSVLVTLCVAILFASALAALRDRVKRPRLVMAGIVSLLAFELLPAPRLLASAEIPRVYDVIKADPDHQVRVLGLPTGIRDGTWSIGRFSAEAQFFQTYHEKRLLGGYLSRVSKRRKQELMGLPVFSAFIKLSEGRQLSPEEEAQAWRGRSAFLHRARLGYVVIDSSRTTPELKEFAIRLLELDRLMVADGVELYRPRTTLVAPGKPSR